MVAGTTCHRATTEQRRSTSSPSRDRRTAPKRGPQCPCRPASILTDQPVRPSQQRRHHAREPAAVSPSGSLTPCCDDRRPDQWVEATDRLRRHSARPSAAGYLTADRARPSPSAKRLRRPAAGRPRSARTRRRGRAEPSKADRPTADPHWLTPPMTSPNARRSLARLRSRRARCVQRAPPNAARLVARSPRHAAHPRSEAIELSNGTASDTPHIRNRGWQFGHADCRLVRHDAHPRHMDAALAGADATLAACRIPAAHERRPQV